MHTATADELARLFGRSPNALRTLASRHQWRRIRLGGRTHYDLAQVAATLAATRARPPRMAPALTLCKTPQVIPPVSFHRVGQT